VIGHRWQELPGGDRNAYECQASDAKEKYRYDLAEYKTKPEYETYQRYLQGFEIMRASSTRSSNFPPCNNR